jgi:CRISPR-associated protein Csa3
MKTALIITLGFDERFCYRAILRHGIREGDKIVLITAGLVDKVKKAYEWIKSFVERSYDVEVRLIEINVRDFTNAIKNVIDILKEFEDYRLVINLSGGMRALAVIVIFALMIKPMRNVILEIELEDLSGVVEIPNSLLHIPAVIANLSDEKVEILKLIAEGLGDVKSLSTKLKKDESTIRRHLSILEELGLIVVEKKKPLKVKTTELASLLLRCR